LRAVGPLAQGNPWRFSTKYQDDETGLLYYGYRFYNPTDGRWPSRDPMGERGGVNLYMLLDNAPLSQIDLLGLLVAAPTQIFTQASSIARPFVYRPDPISAIIGSAMIGAAIGKPIGDATSKYFFPNLTPNDVPRWEPQAPLSPSASTTPEMDKNAQDWIDAYPDEAEKARRKSKVDDCRNKSAKYHVSNASQVNWTRQNGSYRNVCNCLILAQLYKLAKDEAQGRQDYLDGDCDEVPWNKPKPNLNHPEALANVKSFLHNIRMRAQKLNCDMSLFQ
jgi:RHS repeat-associated protein